MGIETIHSGIFEHNRHPGNYYLMLGLARCHRSGIEHIVYVPLRVEPEWAGTARMAIRTVEDFDSSFSYIGERLP